MTLGVVPSISERNDSEIGGEEGAGFGAVEGSFDGVLDISLPSERFYPFILSVVGGKGSGHGISRQLESRGLIMFHQLFPFYPGFYRRDEGKEFFRHYYTFPTQKMLMMRTVSTRKTF